jgi:hypothetical protein
LNLTLFSLILPNFINRLDKRLTHRRGSI